MLNELNGVYRQAFTDGRPLPAAPNPSWQGFQQGGGPTTRWRSTRSDFATTCGSTRGGSVITETATVHERIRRPDFGHVEIEVTVDDPTACTKPWTLTLRQQFASDTEPIDDICAEGERFVQTLKQ
jgi:hypothetical protein